MQRLLESFDGYGLDVNRLTENWTDINVPSAVLSSARGRFGSTGCYLPLQDYLQKTLPASGTWVVGFGLKRVLHETDRLVRFFDVNGDLQCYLRIHLDGRLQMIDIDGLVCGQGQAVLPQTLAAYVEVKVEHGASGTATVRVDGRADFTASGVDLGAATDRIRLGGYGGYFDDVYINDNQGGEHNDFEGPIHLAYSENLPAGVAANPGVQGTGSGSGLIASQNTGYNPWASWQPPPSTFP